MMYFNLMCKGWRKSLEAKTKKNYALPSAQLWHSAKTLCRVPNGGHSAKMTASTTVSSLPRAVLCRVPGTRQRGSSPSAGHHRVPGTRQREICRVLVFAECLALGKELFAECSTFSTRQSRRHLAKPGSPVVQDDYGQEWMFFFYWDILPQQYNPKPLKII